MSSNDKITKYLLDTRIIISGLWVARMLSGLQGDSTRLHDPLVLKSIIEGTGEVIITEGLSLIMSLLFVVPILMSVLTLTLKNPANRLINLITGIFIAMFDLVFLALTLFVWQSPSYEIVWSLMDLVFTGPVVWYAWKWSKQQI